MYRSETWTLRREIESLEQMCTRFLHACSALCKCANWLCRTCTPHHTVAGRSSGSLTQSPFPFPSNYRCGPPLTSYMPGRAAPSRARVHGTAVPIIAHCALWTACAPLASKVNSLIGTAKRDHLYNEAIGEQVERYQYFNNCWDCYRLQWWVGLEGMEDTRLARKGSHDLQGRDLVQRIGPPVSR
jgi:hypothetical protein